MAYKFMPGEHATFLPDVGWKAEATVHNRVVCVSQETGESPAMVAVAENTNPDSPYSFQTQGRWVTRVEENVEAASQAVLNQHAQRLLAGEGTAGRVVSRELLPEAIELNAVVTSSVGVNATPISPVDPMISATAPTTFLPAGTVNVSVTLSSDTTIVRSNRSNFVTVPVESSTAPAGLTT